MLPAVRAEEVGFGSLVVDFFKMEGFAMPISGPTSYVPTAQGFHGHWVLADQTLGQGNEIVLHDGTTADNLNTKTDALVAKRASVKAKLNLAESARGSVEIKKGALINGDVGPEAAVTLLNGYTRANFNTDLAALISEYKTLNDATIAVDVVREERNDLQDAIYAILLATWFPPMDAS
jgi:hypothetical protein